MVSKTYFHLKHLLESRSKPWLLDLIAMFVANMGILIIYFVDSHEPNLSNGCSIFMQKY